MITSLTEITTSPYGDIAIRANSEGITDIAFQSGLAPLAINQKPTQKVSQRPSQSKSQVEQDSQCKQHIDNCKNQLAEFFIGEREHFDLILNPQGTEFQKRIWHALLSIEKGKTLSYGDIANLINNPKGVRAVGTAIGKNPIALVIPCHRVIGKSGKLTGYAGGIELKAKLLNFEKAAYRKD